MFGGDIREWVARMVPVETLVPESAQRWRPVVAEAMGYFFSHLSADRLAVKLAEQIDLPPDTPAERRLLRLISKMPGLQKLGQVLARNPRISTALRNALTELENGISDVTAEAVHEAIRTRLGNLLDKFEVVIEPAILSEASVSAVIRFTWGNADGERERCVFKVLKPHIPHCFAEDLSLLQEVGEHLADRDVNEMLTEVRLLLERELDFEREQQTLAEAQRTYRATLGLRVPRVIPGLCRPDLTAMTEESGVKVTDACRKSPMRRQRIAEQLVEALIAVPLFSGREWSVFHADPHAGNLLYDAPNRELIVLDWALAERLSLASRRQLVMLALMMGVRNAEGVKQAVRGLRIPGGPRKREERTIDRIVGQFFEQLTRERSVGVLEAMRLLDEITVAGVHFEAPLFLFRKSLFTLDGVLRDVAGSEVRMDKVIVRHFLTRWAGSFGLLHSPLAMKDFLTLL